MKVILLITIILEVVQFSTSALPNDVKNSPICGKYQSINVTATQLAGVWYIQGYGSDGSNDRKFVECQKRTFTINADGVTGFVETANYIPTTNASKTYTSPFFATAPGVFVLGQEPGDASIRILTMLYIDSNVMIYHRVASNCGSGDKSSEPRLASRNPAATKLDDLMAIMKKLPTANDFKDYREIPQTNCPK